VARASGLLEKNCNRRPPENVERFPVGILLGKRHRQFLPLGLKTLAGVDIFIIGLNSTAIDDRGCRMH
jgi:hypothetical protein